MQAGRRKPLCELLLIDTGGIFSTSYLYLPSIRVLVLLLRFSSALGEFMHNCLFYILKNISLMLLD